MRAFARRHAVAVSLVPVLGVAAGVFVAVWFQPQRLLYDTTVRDALPAAAASDEVAVLATGRFGDRSHRASGAVRTLTLPDGTRMLRLEGIDIENGPDLHVVLAEAAADAPEQAYESRVVYLGRLKGNKGDQTYAVPADLDLSRYASVVVWCKRFRVAFGTAPLRAA